MKDRINVLKQAVLAGGEAIKNTLPSQGIIQKEGRGNISTAADLASEKAIIDTIRCRFPHDAILSEETKSILDNPLLIDNLWVIDPLDGTNNFRFGRRYSAVAVGYVKTGIVQASAAYDPYHDELFFAQKGQGSFLNDQKIHVSDQDELSKATVQTDNSYDPEGTKRNLEILLQLPVTPWVLIKGSAVLTMCDIACGRSDLFIHTFLKPWDNVSFLIVEEAGGFVRGLNGQEINFLSPEAVMGNPALVRQFLETYQQNQR